MVSFYIKVFLILLVIEIIVPFVIINIFTKKKDENKKEKNLTAIIVFITVFLLIIAAEFVFISSFFGDKKLLSLDEFAYRNGAEFSFAGITKAKYVKDNFTFVYDTKWNSNQEVSYIITDSIDMDKDLHYAFISYIAKDLTRGEFDDIISTLIYKTNETGKEFSMDYNKNQIRMIFKYDPVKDIYTCEMYEKQGI